MIPSRIIPVHVARSFTTALPLLRILGRRRSPEGRPPSNRARLWRLNRLPLSCRHLRHPRLPSVAGRLQVPLELRLVYLSVGGNSALRIRVRHLRRVRRFRLCIPSRKPTLFTLSKCVSFRSPQLLGWLIGPLGTKRDSRGASSPRALGC